MSENPPLPPRIGPRVQTMVDWLSAEDKRAVVRMADSDGTALAFFESRPDGQSLIDNYVYLAASFIAEMEQNSGHLYTHETIMKGFQTFHDLMRPGKDEQRGRSN